MCATSSAVKSFLMSAVHVTGFGQFNCASALRSMITSPCLLNAYICRLPQTSIARNSAHALCRWHRGILWVEHRSPCQNHAEIPSLSSRILPLASMATEAAPGVVSHASVVGALTRSATNVPVRAHAFSRGDRQPAAEQLQ